MLRIVQNQSAAGAKSYYAKADYYSENQELEGHWGGKGAAMLGLEGIVEKEQFERLCDNRHPLSGQQLTPRNDVDRTVLYDFNFSVPKGVSLAYSLGGDERILNAFRTSVHETMEELEADMKTRVRRSHADTQRTTGNIAYALFVHKTARPVAGIPDPFLHAHACVFNATFDEKERRWKAGQFREIKRDAPYFEAAFDARFGKRLQELGYDIARNGKQWDLAAIRPSLCRKFSRRTEQIEKLAEQKGIENPEEKAELGAKSREKKVKELSMSELSAVWDQRLTDEDRQALHSVSHAARQPASEDRVRVTERQALEHAIEHVFERNSVVPKRQVLAEALRYGIGHVDVERTNEALAKTEVIVRPLRGREMATTRSVLAEEVAMLDWARNGRSKCQPLNPKWQIRREWLNAGQQAAVGHILGSGDRVIMLAGKAGVGKTTLLREACEGIETAGRRVFAFAPSTQATKVLTDEGFNATTVARLLVDQQLQQEVAGQTLLIDEAGLIGTRTLKQVFDIAERNQSRVVLSGDWSQHSAPGERGMAMRLLEKEAGIKPARVTTIQRQDGAYRDAVRLLAEGFAQEGFDKLDDLGWVKEIAGDDRDRQLARDYADGIERGEKIQVISPMHVESRRVAGAIRHELRERGLLVGQDQILPRLVPLNLTAAERADPASYASGDVIVVFHQNAKGHRKGERVAIDHELPKELATQAERFQCYRQDELPLAKGDVLRITANSTSKDKKHRLTNGTTYNVAGFTKSGDVKLTNGWTIDQQFGFWDQGLIATSHASQGKTCDRILLAQSSLSFPATSREQAYVSLSRGRKQAVIYTDDKTELRDALTRSEVRLGATELVKDRRIEQARRLARRAIETLTRALRQKSLRREQRKELAHERS